MSMLAEPRRKRRIGPNPRGKFFTEDEDNKGRSLLQKMGWKKGDGLGVDRQGMKEPIKPKIQTDSKGLGFDIKSDPWVSHTDDFNDLLKNLQAANGIITEEEDAEIPRPALGFGCKPEPRKLETNRVDLENKSKNSRSRIHYQKFTRSKDLSNLKKEDWSCIFGKAVDEPSSSKCNIQIQPQNMQITSCNQDSSESQELKDDPDKFVSKGSMQDYFKSKMALRFNSSQSLVGDTAQKEVKDEHGIPTNNCSEASGKLSRLQLPCIFSKEDSEDETELTQESEKSIKKRKKEKKKRRESEKKIKETEIKVEEQELSPVEPLGNSIISAPENHETLDNAVDSKINCPAPPAMLVRNAKGNKRILSAGEYHDAAQKFTGSNILKIQGYRNPSSNI